MLQAASGSSYAGCQHPQPPGRPLPSGPGLSVLRGWVLAALQGPVGDTYLLRRPHCAPNSLRPVHAATGRKEGEMGCLPFGGCRPEARARGHVGCGRKPVQPDANLETPRAPDANAWELRAP